MPRGRGLEQRTDSSCVTPASRGQARAHTHTHTHTHTCMLLLPACPLSPAAGNAARTTWAEKSALVSTYPHRTPLALLLLVLLFVTASGQQVQLEELLKGRTSTIQVSSDVVWCGVRHLLLSLPCPCAWAVHRCLSVEPSVFSGERGGVGWQHVFLAAAGRRWWPRCAD